MAVSTYYYTIQGGGGQKVRETQHVNDAHVYPSALRCTLLVPSPFLIGGAASFGREFA